MHHTIHVTNPTMWEIIWLLLLTNKETKNATSQTFIYEHQIEIYKDLNSSNILVQII